MRIRSVIPIVGVVIAVLSFSGCAVLESLQTGEERPVKFKTPTEHYNRALELYQQDNYDKARDLLHEYIGQYPESPLFKVALYYLGHCYQMLGSDKEALAMFNRIIAVYGDDDFWGEQSQKRIRQIKGEDVDVTTPSR